MVTFVKEGGAAATVPDRKINEGSSHDGRRGKEET